MSDNATTRSAARGATATAPADRQRMPPPPSGTDPGNRSAAEIEQDVERTRAGLARTLDELRDRLSPGQVLDQIAVWAKGSGGAEFARNLGNQVRDNPLPVLLIGAGIGWMMMGGGISASRHRAVSSEGRRALPPPAGEGTGEADAWMREAGPLATRRPGAPHAADLTGPHHAAGAGGAPDRAAEARAAVLGRGGDGGEATGGGLGDRVAGAASAAAHGVADAAASAYHGATEAVAGAGEAAASAYHGAAQAASAAYRGAAEAAGSTWEGMRETTGTAGDRAYRMAQGAREGAGGALDQAGGAARRGWSWLVEEHPLVFGAIGLAIGAAIGAAMPRTETEDRLMGETRDDLARKLGHGARAAAEAVGEQAAEQYGQVRQALDTAAGEARGAVDTEGLRQAGATVTQVAEDITGAVRQALHEGAAEAKDAVRRAGAEVSGESGTDRPEAPRQGHEAREKPQRETAAPSGEGRTATGRPVPDPARGPGPL